MKKFNAAVLVCSLLLTFASPSHAAPDPADRARILQVVEAFRVSVIKKDTATFMQLFYSEAIPWIGITTDKSLARENANKPDPKMPDQAKVYGSGSPRKFIEGIAKNSALIEETFDKVRIDSDGDVAQVWFDYSFNEGNYKQNWGKESWHMVRTGAGWKISSVIWSMEFNPEPPPKIEQKKS